MNTTVVTVGRILLVHPVRLDMEAPDGTCARWGCGSTDSSVDGVVALVDHRYGPSNLPPMSPDGLVMVDPDTDAVMSLDLCLLCYVALDETCGWHCVPFEVEVES